MLVLTNNMAARDLVAIARFTPNSVSLVLQGSRPFLVEKEKEENLVGGPGGCVCFCVDWKCFVLNTLAPTFLLQPPRWTSKPHSDYPLEGRVPAGNSGSLAEK